MPGVNEFVNPSFDDGLSGWNTSAISETLVGVQDGDLIITRGVAGGSPYARQLNLTVGAPYEFLMSVIEITGAAAFGVITGTTKTVTQVGLHRLVVPSISANQGGVIVGQNNSSIRVAWLSARRIDASMSKVILELRDYDGDKKQTSIDLGPVTDGTSYTARAAEAAAIRDAVNAVAGNISRYSFNALDSEPNNVNAATPVYQTHVRWIVEMVDSVSGDGPYAFDIPTADLGNSDLFLPGSVEHDPAAAEWIALKAAMNGVAINYRTGSPMNITRIYLEE